MSGSATCPARARGGRTRTRRAQRCRIPVRPGAHRRDKLQTRASTGQTQHVDLAAGVGDAGNGVHELALHEHPALDLQTQPDEERGRPVEVGTIPVDRTSRRPLRKAWKPGICSNPYSRSDSDEFTATAESNDQNPTQEEK
jgi:hypothetical protein